MKTRIHLARTGSFTDAHGRAVTLDADLLKELAESYDAKAFRSPLVLGHPADGAPAYGWLDKVTVEGGNLYGEVGEIAPELADAVKAGRYRNLSISYWPKGAANSPDPTRATMRHVGVLGAQSPVIKGLAPLAFYDGAAEAAEAVTIEFSEARIGWRALRDFARNVREWIISTAGQEEADRVAPSWLVDDFGRAGDEADAPAAFADPIKPTIEDPSKETPMPGATANPEDTKALELAEREAKLAAREAAVAAEEAKAKAAARTARDASALAFADGLIAAGKLLPAAREIVADIHGRLAASEEPIALADGTKQPARQAFETLFDAAKPMVTLAELTRDDNAATVDGADPDALTARAHAIRKENPAISFSEAIRQAEKEAAK